MVHRKRPMMTTSPICNSRPSIEANPPSPPNRPWPNNRPNKPAPRKPAASPPSSPGRLKKPPPAGDDPNVPGDDGWVTLRWIGDALVGAVRVVGGAENVRLPRLP